MIAGILLRWLGYPHCRLFHRLHGGEPLPVGCRAIDRDRNRPLRAEGDPLGREGAGESWPVPASPLDPLARRPGRRSARVDRLRRSSRSPPSRTSAPGSRRCSQWLRFALCSPGRSQPGPGAARRRASWWTAGSSWRSGIPRCSLTGTAWMILFWKAAAAGWHSYSVGQTAALREQPDFPMQDTSFLRKLLTRQKQLRRLGPRDAGPLARHHCQPRAGPDLPAGRRLKVLLVSPFLPFPLSHGGAVRIYNLCKALADRVDFISDRHPREERVRGLPQAPRDLPRRPHRGHRRAAVERRRRSRPRFANTSRRPCGR